MTYLYPLLTVFGILIVVLTIAALLIWSSAGCWRCGRTATALTASAPSAWARCSRT